MRVRVHGVGVSSVDTKVHAVDASSAATKKKRLDQAVPSSVPQEGCGIGRVMRHMRTWLGRLGLLAAGTVVALLLLEVVLRLKAPGGAAWMLSSSPALYDTSIFEIGARGDWRLRPGARGFVRTPEFATEVRVSQAGTRGPELTDKLPGELRLISVGDSMTLALQVSEEQTFQARIAAALSTPSRPVEIVNGGVDSHGTQASTRQARRLVEELDGDGILLTFFLGNDLVDNQRRPTRGGTMPRQPTVSPLARVSFLWTYVEVLRAARRAAADPGVTSRYRAELSAFTAAGPSAEALRSTRKALRELGELGEELGVPVWVALAPPAFAVHVERAPATMALAELDEAVLDLGGPGRAVADEVPDGVEVVDLGPPLLAAADAPLYFTFDGHWTPAGHQVVGQALADFLEPRLPPSE